MRRRSAGDSGHVKPEDGFKLRPSGSESGSQRGNVDRDAPQEQEEVPGDILLIGLFTP